MDKDRTEEGSGWVTTSGAWAERCVSMAARDVADARSTRSTSEGMRQPTIHQGLADTGPISRRNSLRGLVSPVGSCQIAVSGE